MQVVLTAPEDQLGELPAQPARPTARLFPAARNRAWRDDLDFPAQRRRGDRRAAGRPGPRAHCAESLAQVVARLNAARAARFFRTVALDLPTGLAAFEEGTAPKDQDAAVVADVTLAVGFAKDVLVPRSALGLGRPPGNRAVEHGPQRNRPRVRCSSRTNWPDCSRAASALSYKGDFGKLAIVAGSPGFTGAPVLCAQAAQAMGAGLLSVVTRAGRDVRSSPRRRRPKRWSPAGRRAAKRPRSSTKASAIAIGPGPGRRRGNGENAARRPGGGLPRAHRCRRPERAGAKSRPVARSQRVPFCSRRTSAKWPGSSAANSTPDERESVAREFVDKHQRHARAQGNAHAHHRAGPAVLHQHHGQSGPEHGRLGRHAFGHLWARCSRRDFRRSTPRDWASGCTATPPTCRWPNAAARKASPRRCSAPISARRSSRCARRRPRPSA